MPKISPWLFISLFFIAGCGTSTDTSYFERTTLSPIFSSKDLAPATNTLSISPSSEETWAWTTRPAYNSSLHILELEFHEPKNINPLSSARPKTHGMTFVYPSDTTISGDEQNTTENLYIQSGKIHLPTDSNYTNFSQIVIFATAGTATSSECLIPFTENYPFAFSSVWFRETAPIMIGGIRFDHAVEALRSKYSPIREDYYRGSAYGMCYTIMKTVDQSGVAENSGKKIENDFSNLINSITFF